MNDPKPNNDNSSPSESPIVGETRLDAKNSQIGNASQVVNSPGAVVHQTHITQVQAAPSPSEVSAKPITRLVEVRVHRASFVNGNVYGPDCYFINVTNLSPDREVEITHVWFEWSPQIHVIRAERPLPRRLKLDESWETWLEINELPSSIVEHDVFELGRVRLSTGQVFRSKRNEDVPSMGLVPGDPFQMTGTILRQQISPEIISALWGIGEPNYKPKTDVLKGFLEARNPDLRASNQFFHDDYPGQDKHLLVRYRWPGSPEVKTRTFAENERITFW